MQSGINMHMYEDPAPNIFERGIRAQAQRQLEESARKNTSVPLENGLSDHQVVEKKTSRGVSTWRRGFGRSSNSAVDPVPRSSRRDLLVLEEERKKREQEDAERFSDSELSCEWNVEVRDAEMAKETRKTETKSHRRKMKIRNKGIGVSEAEVDEKLAILKEHLLPEFDRERVLYYGGNMWAELDKVLAKSFTPQPLFLARFQNTFHAPLGKWIRAKVTSCIDGLFCCTWGEIEAALTAYQQESDEFGVPPGMDPWHIFPGDILETNTGSADHPFQRGIVIECFKRARQVDIHMVEYGNHVIRLGVERLRLVRDTVTRDPQFRKFCVCYYKLSEPSAEFEEDVKSRLADGDQPEVEIKCKRHQGRLCWGRMVFPRTNSHGHSICSNMEKSPRTHLPV